MPENNFDERIAETYEAKWPELFGPAVVDPAVSFLADLAGSGAALELGIGTGRIALPLSRRGVRVHGIELSPAMVAQLRTKPGAENIGVSPSPATARATFRSGKGRHAMARETTIATAPRTETGRVFRSL